MRHQWHTKVRAPTNSSLVNHWILLWLLTRVWVRGRYRCRNDSKTAVSPEPTLACMTACQAGNLECPAQPPGSLTGKECLLQAAKLVSSFKHLGCYWLTSSWEPSWSENTFPVTLIAYIALWREEPRDLWSVSGLPEALSCWSLKSFSAAGTASPPLRVPCLKHYQPFPPLPACLPPKLKPLTHTKLLHNSPSC